MEQIVTRIKVGRDGGLHIPASVVRKAGFKPQEEARLAFGHKQMIVGETEEREYLPPEVHSLIGQGKIRVADVADDLGEDAFPPDDLAAVRELLTAAEVDLAGLIREERSRR